MGNAAMNKHSDEESSSDNVFSDKVSSATHSTTTRSTDETTTDTEPKEVSSSSVVKNDDSPKQVKLTDNHAPGDHLSIGDHSSIDAHSSMGDHSSIGAHSSIENNNELNKRLLSVLICPSCRSPLRLRPHLQELHCKAEGVAFPIRSGVPIMTIEATRKLSIDEKLKRE